MVLELGLEERLEAIKRIRKNNHTSHNWIKIIPWNHVIIW